ncbi:MAG TPA: FAD:protein FMN transferase [Ktedonobacterales bacterium]|nr:FAD:protein FMN transferase [Ktedonobacterales bacterium]
MASGRPSASLALVTRAARMMATDVSVQLAVTPAEEVDAALAADACMSWLAEVDAHLSRFRAESELCRLNAASGRWFTASVLLYEAVVCAIHAAETSGGLFDPTLLPLLEAAGYDRDFALIAHRETHPVPSGQALSSPGGDLAEDAEPAPTGLAAWREIECDAASRRIRLPRGARMDLGGIAKGWAADVALERFCGPFANALVNVGGDLRLRGGPAENEAWSIGIRDPRREPLESGVVAPDAYAALVTISRGGLATSGAVRRWWLCNGERRHHLLDPRTGRPVPLWLDEDDDVAPEDGGQPLVATATALAPTAARAEVAAKVALLRGYPAALRAVEDAWARAGSVARDGDCDTGVALALALGSGDVVISTNMAEYLATWGTAGAPLSTTVYNDRDNRE